MEMSWFVVCFGEGFSIRMNSSTWAWDVRRNVGTLWRELRVVTHTYSCKNDFLDALDRTTILSIVRTKYLLLILHSLSGKESVSPHWNTQIEIPRHLSSGASTCNKTRMNISTVSGIHYKKFKIYRALGKTAREILCTLDG